MRLRSYLSVYRSRSITSGIQLEWESLHIGIFSEMRSINLLWSMNSHSLMERTSTIGIRVLATLTLHRIVVDGCISSLRMNHGRNNSPGIHPVFRWPSLFAAIYETLEDSRKEMFRLLPLLCRLLYPNCKQKLHECIGEVRGERISCSPRKARVCSLLSSDHWSTPSCKRKPIPSSQDILFHRPTATNTQTDFNHRITSPCAKVHIQSEKLFFDFQEITGFQKIIDVIL